MLQCLERGRAPVAPPLGQSSWRTTGAEAEDGAATLRVCFHLRISFGPPVSKRRQRTGFRDGLSLRHAQKQTRSGKTRDFPATVKRGRSILAAAPPGPPCSCQPQTSRSEQLTFPSVTGHTALETSAELRGFSRWSGTTPE